MNTHSFQPPPPPPSPPYFLWRGRANENFLNVGRREDHFFKKSTRETKMGGEKKIQKLLG